MSRLGPWVLILFTAVCGLLHAQPRSRVTQRVDYTRFRRLAGTRHQATRWAVDRGRVDADLLMERILLELRSSPEQQADLESLIAGQHDPASRDFRRWLTPEEFGERFGPSQQDIDAVTQWLVSQGFRIDGIARGRRIVEFSGRAGEVERAFHTQVHHYELAGERHVANATDIAIPEALAPVIAGVASLHTFHHQPMHHVLSAGARPSPLTALSSGAQGLGPYDFAAIYNVAPLWNSGFDGAGQSVAISGRSNIRLTDVSLFRALFGLPGNNTQVILNGPDPGIVNSPEEFEADLDVEWSGAVAKSAAIKFVVSKSTNATDGVDLSNQYIVTNNLAPAMSVSFGACEAALGTANSFYNSLWQQAAAQGISVFVASGDAGAAGCDNPNSTLPARGGLAVNGLGSTPYNVSVGGTQFADGANPETYWSSVNDPHNLSAKSYIPEAVWNESSYLSGSGGNSLFAGSGGVSQVYARPAWQTGAGVPAGDPNAPAQHHRYLPDVSLAAAGHDGYLVMRGGGLYLIGGTSASSPAFAGLAAILAQYTGGRNGNLNPRLYSLAAQVPGAFHDVTSGTNAVPCAGGSPGCTATAVGSVGVTAGYAAAEGYDLATGLGSVDAYAMAFNWGAHSPSAPAISSVSPNPMPASAAAQTFTITGANFAAGATVQAGYAGGTATSLPVVSLTGTEISVSIVTGMVSRVWSIVVTNPNGRASFAATLQVTAPPPPPAIASLSPNPMTGSTSSQVLTINGSGFQSGAGLSVSLTYPGGPVTTLSGSQIAFINSAQVLALVAVGTSARAWSVTLTNPNGQSSPAASFNVVAPPPAPAIASLSPNPMPRSSSLQTLTIDGTGFTAGANLRVIASFPGYTAVLQGPQITSVSPTRITALINVGNTARNWLIQVMNPDGSASNRSTLPVR